MVKEKRFFPFSCVYLVFVSNKNCRKEPSALGAGVLLSTHLVFVGQTSSPQQAGEEEQQQADEEEQQQADEEEQRQASADERLDAGERFALEVSLPHVAKS